MTANEGVSAFVDPQATCRIAIVQEPLTKTRPCGFKAHRNHATEVCKNHVESKTVVYENLPSFSGVLKTSNAVQDFKGVFMQNFHND